MKSIKASKVSKISFSGGKVATYNPEQLILDKEGDVWHAQWIDQHADGKSASEAARNVAQKVAEETLKLIRTPTVFLETEEEVDRKGQLIGAIDLINSEIGISYDTHRSILGHVYGGKFHPASIHYDDLVIDLEDNLLNSLYDENISYLAYVSIDRYGWPIGNVIKITPLLDWANRRG